MGWRFHKSFTVIPGLRLNLSKSGLSASIGSAPFTLNVSPRGLMGTASIPGTGISYRHHFDTGTQYPSATPSLPATSYPGPELAPSPTPGSFPPLPTQTLINTAPIEEIHSSSTELLTSATLKDLKNLIATAHQQHEEISSELCTARFSKDEAEKKFRSWERGFLLRRLFRKAFERRKEAFETETARVAELEEQLKMSTISTEIQLEPEQADLFFQLRDKFAALTECAAIWDIKTRQATDKFHERTIASTKLSRERVKFELGHCDLIAWDQNVPHLCNAKGGDLYLFPGFILYRAAREAFSLIEYHDVTGTATKCSFHEEEGVPADSTVIGQTWARANKDGSRDRRFGQNYQIPIAQYGQLVLRSSGGLWEEFLFSNFDRMVNGLNAYNTFAASFAPVTK